MFVGGQSKVGGKLTKNLNFNNCDVEFVCDTGANISILTEATIDMPSLELRKPDCQLTSANCLDLHVAEACWNKGDVDRSSSCSTSSPLVQYALRNYLYSRVSVLVL